MCGDLNIAHTEDDIWNPKGNAKQSGFLPQEREWFTSLLNDGWHDAFREYVGEGVKYPSPSRLILGGQIEAKQESRIEVGESITSYSMMQQIV